MPGVPVTPVEQEVERQECEAEALVLIDVMPLVAQQGLGRLATRDHHVTKRDRGVAAPREHPARQPPVGDVQEHAVAEAGPRSGERADQVTERIRVVPDEPPAERTPADGTKIRGGA